MSPPSSPTPMTVRRLAAEIGGRVLAASGDAAVVRGISHDSRLVETGALFCCVVGQHDDGHHYADEAVAAGATAVLVERDLELEVPQIVVPCVREAMGPASAAVWNYPWRRCTLVGVTGTAGKTTVSHAIGAIASSCGVTCEVVGTLDGSHTTPEAPVLYRRIHGAANDGADMVIVEVSSHALELGRVDGARFSASVFTNLSHEHLDYHGSMEDYFAAKARLFDGRTDTAVINVADPWGRTLAGLATGTTGSVAEWQPSDITDVAVSERGLRGVWRGRPVHCGLLGRFNVANVAAAAAAASAVGLDDDAVAPAISAIVPIPGRLWPVSGPDDDICVLIDFAHKPDALGAALGSARELGESNGRLWTVFGAGGDRDASKRAPMGASADLHADVMVLTSDNPRSEEPSQIAEAIAAGAESRRPGDGRLHIELDRASAISVAIQNADAGDVVVIAGKGHEKAQLIGDRSLPFDDAEVAAEHLRRRRSSQR
ncbi:UDP-N-acetylmuramoyl-L-alanyl-D-glutamate--2,6-diaminopimelate ligase [Candidatus Poriferisodalis sp.]|uniref:UDP-N-acetylmuramoyl-L-alanyl-D-glutamate--2, 6-diaminopimelate ligase n=1 Tax=Candidatus Poriferisodalis sp. TaxID=3101277 RepID=UPI003B018882